MGIATLLSTPTTDDEWAVWSFSHMAHHRLVNGAVYDSSGQNQDLFVLDPMTLDNLGAWTEQHPQMHAAQDAVLGIQGFDISFLDPRDAQSVAVFISQNYELHYAEALATGMW